MTFRLNTVNGNHSSLPNLMKCGLNCLILSYLLCNLLLAAVMAVPEETALDDEPKTKHNSAISPILMKVDKRAAPSRQYNFGIGKRFDYSQDLMEDDLNDSDNTVDEMDKRGPQQRFQFGLGKRAKTEQRFSFGLGKRKPYDSRFQFGLGKRAVPKEQRFGFGLGKRATFEDYIKRRYSFGLGKRNPIDSLNNYYDSSERP